MAEESDRVALGARLKEEREYRGYSQEAVATHLGISRSAVSLMEAGSRKVEALELQRLAELYETTMEVLSGAGVTQGESESVRMVARAASELEPDDQAEVLRFAQFLRSRRNRG